MQDDRHQLAELQLGLVTLQTRAVRALDTYAPLGVYLRARHGRSREAEIAILHRFVRLGDTVLDVGAHRGLYSWHLARLVGHNGRVLAFEPQPDLAAYLRRAFLRTESVTVYENALSDIPGTATLHIPVWDGKRIAGHASLESDRGIDITVALSTIDELEVSPSFVKIDVEGHEAHVLRGARVIGNVEESPERVVEFEEVGRDRARAIDEVISGLDARLGLVGVR